jgi:hypothetical protein
MKLVFLKITNRVATLLTVWLLWSNTVLGQSFDDFLETYKKHIFVGSAGKIPNTIFSVSSTEGFMFEKQTGEILYEIPKLDSILTYQKYPFYHRSDSFRGHETDCICQDSTEAYVRDHLTGYQQKKLSVFKHSNEPISLDNYFFDQVVGWQTWGSGKPTIEQDTVIDGTKCFRLRQKATKGNGHQEHFIDKSNYRLLISNSFNNENILASSFSFEDYRLVQGVVYAYKKIEIFYVLGLAVQRTNRIKKIVFDAAQPREGLYDCTLKSHEIK